MDLYFKDNMFVVQMATLVVLLVCLGHVYPLHQRTARRIVLVLWVMCVHTSVGWATKPAVCTSAGQIYSFLVDNVHSNSRALHAKATVTVVFELRVSTLEAAVSLALAKKAFGVMAEVVRHGVYVELASTSVRHQRQFWTEFAHSVHQVHFFLQCRQ